MQFVILFLYQTREMIVLMLQLFNSFYHCWILLYKEWWIT